MASISGMFSRLALQPSLKSLTVRFYSTRPPPRLGGKVRRKIRGIHYEKALSFDEKQTLRRVTDPDQNVQINIGSSFMPEKITPATTRLQKIQNKQDPELEYAARHQELKVDLDEVATDWISEFGPHHIRTTADHYGIFEDLFNGAFFVPSKQMRIVYDYDDDLEVPVYYGNDIPPLLARMAPSVEYEAEEDTLWTLLMTNPDGHLSDNTQENLHWLVGNIPGNDISSGETLCDYLQPFPAKGTGFHRIVFVLFQQSKRLDFSHHKRSQKCSNLDERTFETLEFVRENQDDLTPLALNFFQADWDDSVRDVFHDIFDLQEPSFEYRHPPPYHPPQRTYPKRQPFDRYYDRYRDKKDLAEEVLRMKLAARSPFKEPETPKYPVLHIYKHRDPKYKPSWLKKREELIARRQEQFKDLS